LGKSFLILWISCNIRRERERANHNKDSWDTGKLRRPSWKKVNKEGTFDIYNEWKATVNHTSQIYHIEGLESVIDSFNM
jgi:hypothetical protein